MPEDLAILKRVLREIYKRKQSFYDVLRIVLIYRKTYRYPINMI